MAKEQAAIFRIEALDKASAVLNRVDKRLAKAGRSAQKLGKAMGVALTVPLALAGAKAVSTFADFELSMAKVKAVSGATGEVFKDLEGDARRLGAATKFSASEVAGLQLEYSKLGFKPDEILKATEATLALSQATDEDLAASAATAGGTLRGFRLAAEETSRVTDVMAKSFSSSALDLEKFSEAVKFVAPNAAEANVSLEETTAYLSVLADNMISGSQAGTSLRRILNELAKTGKPIGQALEELGNKNIGLAEAENLVGRNAQTALLILAKNTDKIKELTDSYNDAGGAAKEMAAIMDNTVAGAFARLRSATEAALISIGQAITPALAPVLEKVTEVIGKVSELNPVFVQIGVLVAGIVAAAAPVILVIGGLISSIGAIAGVLSTVTAAVAGVSFAPIIAGVAAVVAGVLLVVEALGGWRSVMESIQSGAVALGQKLVPVWDAIKAAGAAAWDVIGVGVRLVTTNLKVVFNVLSVVLQPAIKVLGVVFAAVLESIKANLFLVTKVLQGVVVAINVIEVGALSMAKAAISAFNKWADNNQEIIGGLVGFVNKIIGSVEGMVNSVLLAISNLVGGALDKLASSVEPFINGIIYALNDLAGTDFEPIELKVKGLDNLKVDLGRVSVEGINEGRKKVETGIDAMLGDAKGRLGGLFGKLIGQGGEEESETGNIEQTEEAVKKVTAATQVLGDTGETALGKVASATAGAARQMEGLTSQQQMMEDQFSSVTGNMTNALQDFATTGKLDFKDLTRSIISDLARIAIQAQATQLFGSLFGGGAAGAGGGSGIGGVLGKLFSFDGGGYTGSGSRSGGVDGKGGFPAILHPNETVVDHTKGQNGGGGSITIQQTVVIKETVPAAMANSIAEAGKNAALQAIQQIKQRGGRRAAAY